MTPDAAPVDPGPNPTRILLVEDLDEHRTLVELQVATFRHPAVVVAVCETLAAAREVSVERADEIDCIIADLGLPDADGLAVVEGLVEVAPEKAVVVLTSEAQQGVTALRAGAQEYLVKGSADAEDLERAIRYSVTRQALTNELLSTTRDVEHLVYSVSHDLRGPLSVAKGFVALLEDEELPAKAAALIAPIARSLGRIDAISTNLIEYAKAVHGALELTSTDLGTLVRSVVEDQLLGAHVQVADDLPTVLADQRLLRHVFENLLGNAVKYADPSRSPDVVVSATPHPVGWQVNVDDNGVGLSPGESGRVFDMFVRGVDTDDVEGAGIGLAVCRRAVERHNGRIWAEPSPVGPGTRFAFLLPRNPVGSDEAGTSVPLDA